MKTALIIEIIIVLILLFQMYKGYKKGFVKTAIELIATFVVLPIIIIFSIPISSMVVENNPQIKKQEIQIREYLVKELSKKETEIENLEQKAVEKELDTKSMPQFIGKMLNETIKQNQTKTYNEIIKIMAEKIVRLGVQVVIILVLLILVNIVLYIFKGTIGSIVEKLPIISTANNLLGAILQFIKIALILYTLIYVLELGIFIDSVKVAEFLNQTYIIKHLNKFNFIKWFVK